MSSSINVCLIFNILTRNSTATHGDVSLWVDDQVVFTTGETNIKQENLDSLLRRCSKVKIQVFNNSGSFKIEEAASIFIFEGKVIDQKDQRFLLEGVFLEGGMNLSTNILTTAASIYRQS